MTEHLKYSMGAQHTQWTLRLTINQRGPNYKFVMSDTDDDWYIGTNYVSAATANALQEVIEKSIDKAKYSENIDDVFAELQKGFYGSMFYRRLKVCPQLTDGVILGECRVIHRKDGYYVVGDGMCCPVGSCEEGKKLIESLKK